jgi:transposase
VHRELRGQGLTRALLWQESKAPYPEGRPYSPFCEHYRREVGTLALVLRPAPRAGEKGFLDEAGQCVPVVDSPTGEVREAPVGGVLKMEIHYSFTSQAPVFIGQNL